MKKKNFRDLRLRQCRKLIGILLLILCRNSFTSNKSKSEYRNSKQTRMSNDRNSKQGFSHLDLDIENCFGLRISSLEFSYNNSNSGS
jgi:hypothetical protein